MMAAQLQKASSGSGSSPSSLDPSKPTSPFGGALGTSATPAAPPTPSFAPLENRAGESPSPFIQAQKNTLVSWQLFDKAAIDLAKTQNKPIFLHAGFLACHYCHLTIQDSFTNPSVASILNESFIPVVVDREERPDIDAVYWNYLQLINSSAGWPINVFLTPELEPIFGGSYWPGPGAEDSVRGDDDDESRPAVDFLAILEKLKQSWAERETQCRTEAKGTVEQLEKFAAEGTLGPRGLLKPGQKDGAAFLASDLDLDIDQLDEACSHLKRTFDPVNGGFGLVPKFVTPVKYAFMLQMGSMPSVVKGIVGEAETAGIAEMALFTLRKLRSSGLYDHLSGRGFGRASKTINWTLPRFERLIPENALLLSLYLDAWLYSLKSGKKPEGEFLDVVVSLADYFSSTPVQLSGGGFASSESADSLYRSNDKHMREGAYYVWTRREFNAVVGGKDGANEMAARVAGAYWNVTEDGNVDRGNDPHDEFINQNVLYVTKDAAELSRQFGVPVADVKRIISEARAKLLAHREKERMLPTLDGKVVVSTNGLVISALARTGAALKHSKTKAGQHEMYTGAAVKAAQLIKSKLWDADQKELYRVYVGGKRTDQLAFAEDYAYLIEGLLELYEATADAAWLEWADTLQQRQNALFYDSPNVSPPTATHSSSGGFYRSREDDKTEISLLRIKDGMDTTLPATNAVAASNLFRLGSMLGDADYTHLARETIYAFEVEILQHVWLFPGLLAQVVSARLGGPLVAVSGASGASADDVVDAYFTSPRAGLCSLVYTGTADSAWLLKRNASLAAVASQAGAFVAKGGQWTKATPADLVVKAD